MLGSCIHALRCTKRVWTHLHLALSISSYHVFSCECLRRAATQSVPLSLSLSLSAGIETELFSAVYVEAIRFVLQTAPRSWFINRNEIPSK